jgi:phosphoribosylformylglycinamidine cyclo-ligase
LIARDEWTAPFAGGTFADALLAEHPSYYADVRAIARVARVNAMAHITGGGLRENVPRTLPEQVKAVFEQSRWSVPALHAELVRRGKLTVDERYRVLNMGVGFTLVVPIEGAAAAVAAVPGAAIVGWIEPRIGDEPAVVVHPTREG